MNLMHYREARSKGIEWRATCATRPSLTRDVPFPLKTTLHALERTSDKIRQAQEDRALGMAVCPQFADHFIATRSTFLTPRWLHSAFIFNSDSVLSSRTLKRASTMGGLVVNVD
jgi:hypothetical protein